MTEVSEPTGSELQAELDKTQIVLAYVLNTVGGKVVVPRSEELPEGAAIEVTQDDDGNVVIELVVT